MLNVLLLKNLNKLSAENATVRLKKADLVSKIDFGNKLTNFNKQNSSNKTKYLEVQKKVNRLITIDYSFFLK